MLLPRSFSPLTVKDIRTQGQANRECPGVTVISAPHLTRLCQKYDLSRIEAALLLQATLIDPYGRIAE